jgi:hypothetical protein
LAETLLADRLEPGEQISMVERVRTGSLLGYLAVATAAWLVWIVVVALILADHLGVFSEGVVKLIGFAAIILIASRLLLKDRCLVLTDRRLFLCQVTWFLERPSGVEAEMHRSASAGMTVRRKDRWISIDDGAVRVRFRGTPSLASTVQRWANV